MILGYVFVGAFAGLIAAGVALLLGTSFWFAFGLYALVGSLVVIVLPAAQMAAGLLVDHPGAESYAQGQSETYDPRPAEPLFSHQDVAVEAPMRILAVDDDPFILELVPMIAATAGFTEVTPAESGEQALNLLARSEMIFDCLLFDISMPGMDGIELCRRVRQIPQYENTPIIMLTAMRDMQSMGDAYRAGATDYATKPFDIEQLSTQLRLAQQAILAQKEEKPDGLDSSTDQWWTRGSYRLELSEISSLRTDGSLVEQSVLSNYLTQLPRNEVTQVQVFAIDIDGIDEIYRNCPAQEFSALLEGVAAAATDCFGADRTVMAYTDNATLLIATNSSKQSLAIIIEDEIEKRLEQMLVDFPLSSVPDIGLSVGGPVWPHSNKAERARIATYRVINMADNRALEKQGRATASIFKH